MASRKACLWWRRDAETAPYVDWRALYRWTVPVQRVMFQLGFTTAFGLYLELQVQIIDEISQDSHETSYRPCKLGFEHAGAIDDQVDLKLADSGCCGVSGADWPL